MLQTSRSSKMRGGAEGLGRGGEDSTEKGSEWADVEGDTTAWVGWLACQAGLGPWHGQ